MKKLTFILIVFLLAVAPCFAQAAFEQAKAQLQQDHDALVKTAGVVVGSAAAAGLVGYVVNRALYTPINLVEMTARLAAPSKGNTKSARYLIREKGKLRQEASALSRVAAMAKQRQQEMAPKGPFYKQEWLPASKYKRLKKEYEILEKIFQDKYEAFNRRFYAYKTDYKEFLRTGKINRLERSIAKIASEESAVAGKQILRRGGKALPLFLLLVWASSSDLSAEETGMARRMGTQPALLLSLSQAEENKIKNNAVLTQIYIQTAQEIHQLRSLTPSQWQALAQESAGEEFATKQLPLLRQQLIKALAK